MSEVSKGSVEGSAERRLREWALWAVYGLAILSALGLLSLVLFESFSRQITWWGKLLIISFMVLCVVLWFFEKREALGKKQAFVERLRDPNTLQAILTLVLLFASALPNVLSMIRPSSALEDTPRLIQDTVLGINAMQNEGLAALERIERNTAPTMVERAPIFDAITGLWGEPGCEVIWRISARGTGVEAEVVTKPDDLPSYRYIGSVVSAEGMTLQSVGEEPANAKGMAATFTVDSAGAIRRLSWSDRARSVPLLLEPCN